MEKINESIAKYEKAIPKEIAISSLSDLNQNLDALKIIISRLSEKIEQDKRIVDSADLLSDSDMKFTDFKQQITILFSNLINSTEKIYANWKNTASPKEILILIVDKFFQRYMAENSWGIDIYNEIIDDLKLKIELNLVDAIEQEILNVRGNIEDIEKIPQALKQSLTDIHDFIAKVKEISPQARKKSKNELFKELFSNVGNLYEKLSQNSTQIRKETNSTLLSFSETHSRFLTSLQKEISFAIQEHSLKIRELEAKISELSTELERTKRETRKKPPQKSLEPSVEEPREPLTGEAGKKKKGAKGKRL